MAKKTIHISDLSGKEVREGTGATITIKFNDARKGQYVLDTTDAEAEELGQKGRKQARRGRKAKSSVGRWSARLLLGKYAQEDDQPRFH